MSRTPDEVRRHLLDVALRSYRLPAQRAAMRSAFGDAAAICDVIAEKIRDEHRRRNYVTKYGRALADVAKRCGDFLWEMRDQVRIDDPPSPTPSEDTSPGMRETPEENKNG